MIYIKFVPDIKFSRLSISLSIGLFNMKTFIFRFVFLLIATVKLALCFIMTTRVKRWCNLFWIMIYPSCHSAGGKFIYNISFIMMKLVVYTSKICHEILLQLSTLFFKIDWLIDWLIDWCLTPTLAIFQLYRGVNKFYINLRHLQDP